MRQRGGGFSHARRCNEDRIEVPDWIVTSGWCELMRSMDSFRVNGRVIHRRAFGDVFSKLLVHVREHCMIVGRGESRRAMGALGANGSPLEMRGANGETAAWKKRVDDLSKSEE